VTSASDVITISDGLRFHSSPWVVGLSILLVLLVAAVGLWGWWRSGLSPGFGLLEALRVLIAAFIATLLNQPEWVTEQRPVEKPAIAVLIDDSPSMETVDVRSSGGGAGGDEAARGAFRDPHRAVFGHP
jgi:hypothetical protein